jgi:hypothetical protein
MKNLKRYKIFESVQLWERIDALTYFKYAYSETEMPAQSGLEIQKLTDDKYSVQYYLAQNSFLFDFTDESNGKEDMKTVNIRITKKTNGSLSNIMTELVTYYTTDDWYLVKIHFYEWRGSWRTIYGSEVDYYKCDTIDGLVQLIEEVKSWSFQ